MGLALLIVSLASCGLGFVTAVSEAQRIDEMMLTIGRAPPEGWKSSDMKAADAMLSFGALGIVLSVSMIFIRNYVLVCQTP